MIHTLVDPGFKHVLLTEQQVQAMDRLMPQRCLGDQKATGFWRNWFIYQCETRGYPAEIGDVIHVNDLADAPDSKPLSMRTT